LLHILILSQIGSDANKDLRLKAEDLDPKAKAKDLGSKAKAKTKDDIFA